MKANGMSHGELGLGPYHNCHNHSLRIAITGSTHLSDESES
jgi:hypothetical protein